MLIVAVRFGAKFFSFDQTNLIFIRSELRQGISIIFARPK